MVVKSVLTVGFNPVREFLVKNSSFYSSSRPPFCKFDGSVFGGESLSKWKPWSNSIAFYV